MSLHPCSPLARILLVVFPTALTPICPAQDQAETLAAVAAGGIGRSLSIVGDVDGDGVRDLAASCSYCDGLVIDGGRVGVYSGRDGTQLATLRGDTEDSQFGAFLCDAGDWNGDGVPDIAVASPSDDRGGSQAGAVSVHSGTDGSLLWLLLGIAEGDELGLALASAGDVDGDGQQDLMIGIPRRRIGGQTLGAVELRRGGDGALLHTFVGSGGSFGREIARAGDVNADGKEDFLISSPFEGDSMGVGHVRIFSGLDYSVLQLQGGTSFDEAFGICVSGLGDVNADGHDDYLVGSDENYSGFPIVGYVRVYSGADGSILLHKTSGSSVDDRFPRAVAPAGDLDHDGVVDFAVAAPFGQSSATKAGIVYVYSGSHGEQLASWSGSQFNQQWGSALSTRDIDGDGRVDLFIGVPGSQAAWLVTPSDGSPGQRYCTSTPNSTGSAALIQTAGSDSVALNDLQLLAGPVPDGQFGSFYYGSQSTEQPLGDGTRCVGGGATGVIRLPIVPTESGQLTWSVDLANPPVQVGQVLPGATWYFQAWFRDPLGGPAAFNLSDGYRIVFRP